MSRKTEPKTRSNRYFSDKLFYISSKTRSPVLITPDNLKDFSFQGASNIWYIQRNEMEKEIVHDGLSKFGIDPSLILSKSLIQKSFVSDFWKNLITYTKTHNKDLLNSLPKLYAEEQIGLLVLVNRMKGMFEIFLKDEVFQIISQYDIPILILQAKTSMK